MLGFTLKRIGKKIKKAIQKSKIESRERSRNSLIINSRKGKIKRGQ